VTLDADVVVIGAGLSGLVCARRLVEGGLRVVVLEARDRVGGRLHTGRVGDQLVDLGGHLMTATQDRLAALADELGIESAIPDRSGKQRFPKGGLFAALAQYRAVLRIQRLMKLGVDRHRDASPDDPAENQVGVDRHRGADRAERHRRIQRADLDARTLADHLASIRNSVARERLALHAELIFAADPADLSLLAYLQRMAVTGGFAPQGELPGGGRERFFHAGAQELAIRLASDLEAAATQAPLPSTTESSALPVAQPIIRLSSNVVAIEQGDEGVRVVVNAGSECEQMPDGGFAERLLMKTFAAKRVVLAIPPAIVRHIRVELPPAARAFVERAHVGGVVKIFVAYDRAFWRDAGYSGEAYRPARSGEAAALNAVRAVVANGNVLVAFVVGREAARWAARGADDRRREVIDTLAEEFGEAARDAIDYVEADWAADPWSAGCVASTPVGAITKGAAWGEAFDRVHVAGTEAARVWTGYMDGAIEAGERAASEVLAASD
jgi:monoamine oxidase